MEVAANCPRVVQESLARFAIAMWGPSGAKPALVLPRLGVALEAEVALWAGELEQCIECLVRWARGGDRPRPETAGLVAEVGGLWIGALPFRVLHALRCCSRSPCAGPILLSGVAQECQ